ncbi:MAG: hypothetical protein EP343_26730 [Deltaproteobacteria bacterium]|nr:MAG: hypothetical protein EP343_26730 [Deltaproteobacteria bacterium]
MRATSLYKLGLHLTFLAMVLLCFSCGMPTDEPCKGVSCPPGETCNNGLCEGTKVITCKEGKTRCGQDCAVLGANSKHCGACNNACADGEVCMLGECKKFCGIGYENCNGGCVQLKNTGDHCGRCGNDCQDKKVCSNSACEESCPANQKACGSSCVDVRTNAFHCGDCFKACGKDLICNGGVCEKDSFSGTPSTFDIVLTAGELTLATCSFTRTRSDGQNSEYDMDCPNLPSIKMVGLYTSATNYSLKSNTSFNMANLTNWSFFNLLGGKFNTVLGFVKDGLSTLDGLKLAIDSDHNLHLDGQINLNNAGDTSVGKGLKLVNRFFDQYIPGYQTPTPLKIILGYASNAASVSLRITPIAGCASKTLNEDIGTKFKFQDATLVFTIEAGISGASVSAAIVGFSYIKPTKLDDWLMFEPSVTLSVSSGPLTMTLGGEIPGACPEECASSCGCLKSACDAPWKPLNLTNKFTLSNGTIEVGINLVAPIPPPVISLGFTATVGTGSNAATGNYLGVFNLADKQYGYLLEMKTVNLKPLMEMLVGSTPVSVIPTSFKLRGLKQSYAMSKDPISFTLKGKSYTIPKGFQMEGSIEYSGLSGRVEANNVYVDVPSLESLKSGAFLFAVAGPPQGKIEFEFDMSGLLDKVLNKSILSSFKSTIQSTLYVEKVGFKLSSSVSGSTVSYSAGASAGFRLFGSSHSVSFDAGIAFDPDDVATEIAQKVKNLAEGGFSDIYNGAKDIANKAGKAVSNAASATWSGIKNLFKGKINPKLKCPKSDSSYSTANGCFTTITESKTLKAKCGKACTKSAGDVCTSSNGSKGSGDYFKRDCTFSKTCVVPAQCGGCWKASKGQSLRLNCVGGKQGGTCIHIMSAVYGDVGGIDPSGRNTAPSYCNSNPSCKNSNSLDIVKRYCQGKKTCSIPVTESVFGSLSCPHNGLQVSYVCAGCPVGSYLKNGGKECAQCPYGTYQDETGKTSCKSCPPGTTTKYLGSTSQDTCVQCPGDLNCTHGCYYRDGNAYCKCEGGGVGLEEYCDGNNRYYCKSLSKDANPLRTKLGSCTHGCLVVNQKSYCGCQGGTDPGVEYCSNSKAMYCELSTNADGELKMKLDCGSQNLGCEESEQRAYCECPGGHKHGTEWCDNNNRMECQYGRPQPLGICFNGCYMSEGAAYCKCQGGRTGSEYCTTLGGSVGVRAECPFTTEPNEPISYHNPCSYGCYTQNGGAYCKCEGGITAGNTYCFNGDVHTCAEATDPLALASPNSVTENCKNKNATCSTSSKTCVCRSGEKFCNGVCKECCSSSDCSAGRSCDSNGRCQCPTDKPYFVGGACRQCTSDLHCGGTSRCSNYVCTCPSSLTYCNRSCYECCTDSHCGNGGTCSGNKCSCPAGKYFSNGSCVSCPAGQYKSSAGSHACSSCPTGKYASGTGNTSCTSCPRGQYQNLTGQTSCKACPAGRYASSTGRTSCVLCPSGMYQNNTSQSACKSCAAGTYASSTGRTSCTLCPKGMYQDKTRQASCLACPTKTYASSTGSTSCTTCPNDTYQDQPQQASCKACPSGKSCCGGAIVNTSIDPTHCGACGNVCSGVPCLSGLCGGVCSISVQKKAIASGHTKPIFPVVASPKGDMLATGSEDGTVKLWDVKNPLNPVLLSTIKAHSALVHALTFDSTGQLLATGAWDNEIKVWWLRDPKNPRNTRIYKGHSDYVLGLTFTPNGDYLISGGRDAKIKIWSIGANKIVTTLSQHTRNVYSVLTSPDGKFLYSASVDNSIRTWDITKITAPKALAHITSSNGGHTNYVYKLALTADGRTLASGSRDQTVKLWEVNNPAAPKLYKTLTGHTSLVLGLSFRKDGKELISAGYDSKINIWNTANPKNTSFVRTLPGSYKRIWGIAHSADGKYLYSGGRDDSVLRVWGCP